MNSVINLLNQFFFLFLYKLLIFKNRVPKVAQITTIKNDLSKTRSCNVIFPLHFHSEDNKIPKTVSEELIF